MRVNYSSPTSGVLRLCEQVGYIIQILYINRIMLTCAFLYCLPILVTNLNTWTRDALGHKILACTYLHSGEGSHGYGFYVEVPGDETKLHVSAKTQKNPLSL